MDIGLKMPQVFGLRQYLNKEHLLLSKSDNPVKSKVRNKRFEDISERLSICREVINLSWLEVVG